MEIKSIDIATTCTLIIVTKHVVDCTIVTDATVLPIYVNPFYLGDVGYRQFNINIRNKVMSMYDISHITIQDGKIYYDNINIGSIAFIDNGDSVMVNVMISNHIPVVVDVVLGDAYKDRKSSTLAFRTLFSDKDLSNIYTRYKHIDEYLNKKHIYISE